MKKTKINNFVVKPIKIPVDTRPVLGADLFTKAFCTVYLCGKKESGKTQTLYNMMKARTETNTTIVIFSATLDSDPAWLEITKEFEKNEIPLILHTSIYEEDGTNLLRELLQQLDTEAAERKKALKDKKLKKKEKKDPAKWDDEEDEKKEKPPKYLAADWIIVIDDLSDEIKDKTLEKLMKLHRHHKSMVCVSNQALNDFAVASRKQVDYYILYRNMDKKKLEEIYEKCNLRVSFERFYAMYNDAVYGPGSEPWYFFYFTTTNKPSYRQNFNIEYNLKEIKNIMPYNDIDTANAKNRKKKKIEESSHETTGSEDETDRKTHRASWRKTSH